MSVQNELQNGVLTKKVDFYETQAPIGGDKAHDNDRRRVWRDVNVANVKIKKDKRLHLLVIIRQKAKVCSAKEL